MSWKFFRFFLLPIACFFLSGKNVKAAGSLVLSNASSVVRCDPGTLQLELKARETPFVIVSESQAGLGPVRGVTNTATTAQWEFADRGVQISLQLIGSQIAVHILAKTPGDFAFPILAETPATRGWILPLFEGVYAPSGEARWISFLTKHGEMNTTADLSMPFLGLDFADFTLTCLVTNPFNNRVAFQPKEKGRLQARLTHQFTRNHAVKEYGVVFQLGTNSPVEPARIYRAWLKQRGEFASLREKIQKTPEAEKLLGAAHVYLWGDALMGLSDVRHWKDFAQKLQGAATATNASPARRIWVDLPPAARAAVTNIIQSEWPDKYNKSLVLAELNALLLRKDFYEAAAWSGLPLDEAVAVLARKDRFTFSPSELCRWNSACLFAAFPGLLARPEQWGQGVSPKMIQELADAGLDRLWLGSGSWSGFSQRPETVEVARRLGFLIGPYDSYHSMHPPSEPNTWETAQLGADLYQTGAIVNADGTKRKGFKQKGYLLSPVAARPAVEKRVSDLMRQFRANSWFMDCDGFGEYFDDYAATHPATQLTDMLARNGRMAWIRDTYGAVIGTEGCSAGVAATVHFAHGVLTPVIGWGDADLTNKQSKYYLGAYYPPDAPAMFFKTVPIKEKYRALYYDPRFRLPLFQTVFHDAVIATHHWTNPSFKFAEVTEAVALLELLYNVPPLYHLNPAEFARRKDDIQRHFTFFSPLHRELALLPMTDFRWLSADKLVQQTVFGDEVEITANFGGQSFENGGENWPAQSVSVHWRKSGRHQTHAVLPRNP